MWSSDSALLLFIFAANAVIRDGKKTHMLAAHTSTISQFTTKYSFYKSALFHPREEKKNKNLPDTYIYIHRTAIEHSVCAKNCLPSSQRYDDQIELNDKLKGTHHDAGKSSTTTKTRVYNEIKCE